MGVSVKIRRAAPYHWNQSGDEHIEFVDSLLIRRQRQEPGLNRRMFDEDFSRLFHFMAAQSDDFLTLVSNDDQLVRKLLEDVKARYACHSIDETIRNLAEEIAQSLIWFGRAYYFLHDDTAQDKIHLTLFRSGGIVKLFNMYVQWVPKHRERDWIREDKEHPREVRILNSSKIMRFVMPKSIKRMLSAQNRTLDTLDRNQYSGHNFLPLATHENPSPTVTFDFNAWKDTQEQALFRGTQGTGWNARKYDSSKRSDFFDCYRLIRFRRNQLFLRDDIFEQLSNELSRVGKEYREGFSVQVSASDRLASIDHLNELENRLEREEVGFREIIDYCYKA